MVPFKMVSGTNSDKLTPPSAHRIRRVNRSLTLPVGIGITGVTGITGIGSGE
jgi:hypothetical protein